MEAVPESLGELLADAAFEALVLLDHQTIVWCNRAFEEMIGETRERLLGRSPLELCAPEDHAAVVEAIRSGSNRPYEVTGIRADGERFPAEVRGRTVEAGGKTYRISALRDLSLRAAMEESLRQREARYRHLFDAAADGLLVMDDRAMPREVNARLCEMLGRTREEILGMTPDQAIADLEARPLRLERLLSEPSYVVERELLHADGSRVAVEVNVSAIGPGEVLAVIRDARDRKRSAAKEAALRDRLLQAQSLEAIGRLAGGVAHDFNNLLTVILAAGETLARRHDDEDIEEILDASHRAAQLTARLLTFSGHRAPTSERVDAAEQVEQLAPLLRRLLGDRHELSVVVEGCPPPVGIDPSELTQLVMNLVVNARDVMPDGGRIEVRLAEEEGDLALVVTDEGPGIPPDVRDRLFEPFFTTKGSPRHAGLGLSTVYGIVTGLGGRVRVESDESGARFRLRLPSASEPAPGVRARATARPLRILLVEDDDAVRRVVHQMLLAAGHEVVEASGIEEAHAIMDGERPPEVLLSDIVMPGGSGVDLAERFGSERTLLMTGYPDQALGTRSDLRVLAKPFTTDELQRALAELETS